VIPATERPKTYALGRKDTGTGDDDDDNDDSLLEVKKWRRF
jgi:hypothetical protein